jgi:hypothetical protein
MAKTKSVEIHCEHCREWFRSPINFGESVSFDTSTLIGNQVQCSNPDCGRMTGCNKASSAAKPSGGAPGNGRRRDGIAGTQTENRVFNGREQAGCSETRLRRCSSSRL